MRTKRLVKTFDFLPERRSVITLGAGTRLNPQTFRLQLEEQPDGTYLTTADLTARTWTANPQSAQQWLGFQAFVQHQSVEGVQVTDVRYRLNDGTDDYWWDGGAWAVNNVNWNTETEIAANIPTFPSTSRQIQVVINLSTSNARYTPAVEAIKILYSSTIEHQEDYLRSLLRLMKQEIRPIAAYPVRMASTTDTIDLDDSAYVLETPYNVVDIDAVYNYSDDPERHTNILQSYDANTKVLSLTGPVDVNKLIWIRLVYEPEVVLTTGQDYYEFDKVPAVVLSDVNLVDSAEPGHDDSVINRADNTAVKVPGPLQADFDITLRGLTDKAVDQHRLADELKRFFRNNPLMRSLGMDETFRLWLQTEYDMQTVANQKGLQVGQLRFRIVKAAFFERDAVDSYAVESFRLTGDMDATTN